MRSLVVSVICMAVIISGWGVFVNHADRNIHELTGMIDNDILKSVYAEDWDSAQAQFADLSKKWHEQKKTYTYFFHTEAIMETDYSIARAEGYIKSNNVPLAAGELNLVRKQLGFLHLNELITLDNVF